MKKNLSLAYYILHVTTRPNHSVKQGRPTRDPRARSGPPKILKWPTKGFCVGWLIDASALTL